MMPKWLIEWNASGYVGGENYEVVEAETKEEAVLAAYEAAREQFESDASYDAQPLTKELAEEHGFEDRLDKTEAGTP